MELDDLKEKWKASNVPSNVDIREALERKVSVLKNSGRGLKRVFYIELAVAGLAFIVLLSLALSVGERMTTYMIKIIIVTTIGSLPVIWRLYKSQQWLNSMDYSQDIRSNLEAFLKYYKTTLRIYLWSCYLVTAVLILAMFYDDDFVQTAMRIRIRIIVYMVSVSVLAAPYIWFLYGRRTARIEEFLRD